MKSIKRVSNLWNIDSSRALYTIAHVQLLILDGMIEGKYAVHEESKKMTFSGEPYLTSWSKNPHVAFSCRCTS